MRRARVTYNGAFHHAVNRGYDGKAIFSNIEEKELFLELLGKNAKELRIRVLAYCLMDNHYHLILENSSGRMADFFKQLNGQFASIYRKRNGGRGYVFQDRYKSMLIQDDSYLLLAIAYVLNNPVRASVVENFLDYKWSSSFLYFSKKSSDTVDSTFVEEMFGNYTNLINLISNTSIKQLPYIRTRMGTIIGGEEFAFKAIEKFDCRSGKESIESKRFDDKYFEPVQKVFYEFKNMHGIETDEIDITTYIGKRLRGELLVYLKERAGLRYREIIKIPLFGDVQMNSLGRIYKNAKLKMSKKK